MMGPSSGGGNSEADKVFALLRAAADPEESGKRLQKLVDREAEIEAAQAALGERVTELDAQTRDFTEAQAVHDQALFALARERAALEVEKAEVEAERRAGSTDRQEAAEDRRRAAVERGAAEDAWTKVEQAQATIAGLGAGRGQ